MFLQPLRPQSALRWAQRTQMFIISRSFLHAGWRMPDLRLVSELYPQKHIFLLCHWPCCTSSMICHSDEHHSALNVLIRFWHAVHACDLQQQACRQQATVACPCAASKSDCPCPASLRTWWVKRLSVHFRRHSDSKFQQKEWDGGPCLLLLMRLHSAHQEGQLKAVLKVTAAFVNQTPVTGSVWLLCQAA